MLKITKKELEKKYHESTIQNLSIELGISVPTLMKYLKEAGIPLKGKRKKIIINE